MIVALPTQEVTVAAPLAEAPLLIMRDLELAHVGGEWKARVISELESNTNRAISAEMAARNCDCWNFLIRPEE